MTKIMKRSFAAAGAVGLTAVIGASASGAGSGGSVHIGGGGNAGRAVSVGRGGNGGDGGNAGRHVRRISGERRVIRRGAGGGFPF